MDDWQPIETAPRNLTKVLVGRFTSGKSDHNGHIEVDYWHTRESGNDFEGWGKFNAQYWPATHWMPLPAPPIKG